MPLPSSTDYLEQAQYDLLRGGFALRYLQARGLTETTIRRYLLGYDAHRKAIVIPYLNALEEVRRLRYRNFESEPKYIWDAEGERGAHLFHVRATRKRELWMTEGEFDAMVLGQMGFTSVAVPGAKLFKPEWKYLFAYCQKLTLVFDKDPAGFEGAQRVASILGPVVAEFRMVRLPEGKDVNDLYLYDRSALLNLIS